MKTAHNLRKRSVYIERLQLKQFLMLLFLNANEFEFGCNNQSTRASTELALCFQSSAFSRFNSESNDSQTSEFNDPLERLITQWQTEIAFKKSYSFAYFFRFAFRVTMFVEQCTSDSLALFVVHLQMNLLEINASSFMVPT